MVGFKGDLIHMFNKNENAIHSSDYFDKLRGRNNIILMGDSLGDTKMAVGVPQPSSILKIGFLNDKVRTVKNYLLLFELTSSVKIWVMCSLHHHMDSVFKSNFFYAFLCLSISQ